jgi:AAA family ATP:ADP antiporter
MAASDAPLRETPRASVLDRFLSLFSRVQAGEGISVVLLIANLFLLLGAYYTLKIVRDSLIVADKGGAAAGSYASAAMAVVLVFLLPAYGRFGTRVDRIRLISWVTLFFVTHLPVFYLLALSGVKIGFAFYVWLGIFNNLVVAQCWAFANDLYTEEQGKRLFPLIGVGASLGAWVGSYGSNMIFRAKTFGAYPYPLMVVAAGIFVVCILLSIAVHRRESGRAAGQKAEEAKEPLGKEGGFELIIGSPYLRWIALMILLLNVVNTMGGFLLNSFNEQEAAKAVGAAAGLSDQRGSWAGVFISNFYMWQNLLGLLIQLFLVSRIFRWIGVRGAMLVLPCIALGGYALLTAIPTLAIVRLVKLAENATDYSLQNTVRHALFLPTKREAKYKAKAAIDTFFVRTGDALQALLVYGGLKLGFTLGGFAAMNVAFVAAWLGLAALVFREHKAISRES